MKNWKEIVKSVAPAIGGALGGPLGALAVKKLGEHWLGKSDATEDDAMRRVSRA